MAVFKNGIFAYDNGKPVTPQSLGISLSGIQTCQQFFSSGSITDSTQKYAIYALVGDLETYGIWNKMKVIYPFVGQPGVSSSFEFNLKDPNTFRGTFYGGFTFSNLGVTPNNGYMTTGFISNNEVGLNSVHYSNYFRDFQANDGAAMGVDNDATGAFLTVAWNYAGAIFNRFHTSISTIPVNNSQSGFKILSRTASTTTTAYHNGLSIGTSAVSSVRQPIIDTWVFARNSDGGPSFYSRSSQQFCSIGDGLTDTEAANLYTAVQRFQTTLGRQV